MNKPRVGETGVIRLVWVSPEERCACGQARKRQHTLWRHANCVLINTGLCVHDVYERAKSPSPPCPQEVPLLFTPTSPLDQPLIISCTPATHSYVTAWNNLGDAYERTKAWRSALSAYQEALSYAPSNDIARQRTEFCKTRVERLGL
eukprot:355908-Chlamydomonas_euryale.AAC.13